MLSLSQIQDWSGLKSEERADGRFLTKCVSDALGRDEVGGETNGLGVGGAGAVRVKENCCQTSWEGKKPMTLTEARDSVSVESRYISCSSIHSSMKGRFTVLSVTCLDGMRLPSETLQFS